MIKRLIKQDDFMHVSVTTTLTVSVTQVNSMSRGKNDFFV